MGQGGCELSIEAFVKIQKKNFFFFFFWGGGGGGGVGSGGGGGEAITKKKKDIYEGVSKSSCTNVISF